MKKLVLSLSLTATTFFNCFAEPITKVGAQNFTQTGPTTGILQIAVGMGPDVITIDQATNEITFTWAGKHYRATYTYMTQDNNLYGFGLKDMNEMEY